MSGTRDAVHDILDSDGHYRVLWNHAVDSELITDTSGIVLDINRRAEVKLGHQVRDLIGASAVDLFVEADRPRFIALLRQVAEAAREASAVGMRVPTADGSILTTELDLVPI